MKQDINYNVISFHFRNKQTFNKFVRKQLNKRKRRNRRDSSCVSRLNSRSVSKTVSRSNSPREKDNKNKRSSIMIKEKVLI